MVKKARCHAAFWPPVRSKHLRNHRIAALVRIGIQPDKYEIVWEDLEPSVPVSSYNEWKAIMKENKEGVDIYVGDLMDPSFDFPWERQALADKQARVNCTKNGGITSITVRQGSHWSTVSQFSSWFPNWQDLNIVGMMNTILHVCVDAGCGIQPSPSALGATTQSQLWKGKVVSRPPNPCRKDLLKHLIGGRVELNVQSREIGKVYEIDLRSAYASCSTRVPVGSTITVPMLRKKQSPVTYQWLSERGYATWFAKCIVTIHKPLKVGPFGVRLSNKNIWSFPKQPGVYGDTDNELNEVWLWREEMEDCLAVGCSVQILTCYAWERLSAGLTPWVRKMQELREVADREEHPERGKIYKTAIVAAIGRFGISPMKYRVILEKDAIPGDEVLCNKGKNAPIGYYAIKKEHDENCPAPVHWHGYILMQCRRKMYHRELQEVLAGNAIVASNFDAIYLLNAPKGSTGYKLGEWKPSVLTEVRFPFRRAVVAKEKQNLPGQHGYMRHKYISKAKGYIPYSDPNLLLSQMPYALRIGDAIRRKQQMGHESG